MRTATLRVLPGRFLFARAPRVFASNLSTQAAAAGSMPARVPLLINGSEVHSAAVEDVPVTDPATQLVLARTPLATTAEMEAAVAAAKNALPAWSATSAPNRCPWFQRSNPNHPHLCCRPRSLQSQTHRTHAGLA